MFPTDLSRSPRPVRRARRSAGRRWRVRRQEGLTLAELLVAMLLLTYVTLAGRYQNAETAEPLAEALE